MIVCKATEHERKGLNKRRAYNGKSLDHDREESCLTHAQCAWHEIELQANFFFHFTFLYEIENFNLL